MQGFLLENSRPVSGAVPLNITGAGFNSSWVGLKFHTRMLILLQSGAWAGGTAAVTLNQAKDIAGTGSKALAFNTVYISTTVLDIPVKTAVVSNTFNIGAANTLYAIEILSYDLDVNNLFAYVQTSVATPGANADFLACIMIPYSGGINANATLIPSVLL